MRPELINRIDKIVVFRALSKDVVRDIVDVQLSDLQRRLIKKRLAIKVHKKAKEWLLEKGYDQKNGVRPLRRVIQDEIEDVVAEKLLSEEYGDGDVIGVTAAKDGLKFGLVKE
jgi:ATP-dependent Clp protease ATP-binding subunit ClpA